MIRRALRRDQVLGSLILRMIKDLLHPHVPHVMLAMMSTHGSGFPLAYTPVRVKDELPHFVPWHTNGSPDDSPFPSLCCPERPPPNYQTHLEGYWMVGSDGTMRWAEYPRTLNTLELPTNVSFEPHHWVGHLCPDFKLITETGPWLTVDHPTASVLCVDAASWWLPFPQDPRRNSPKCAL